MNLLNSIYRRRPILTKKRKEGPRREVTKRQLARWQQQRKRQRIILSVGILVIVVVLGVMGVGWYLNQYRPRHETAFRVNDTEFSMDYYVKALKFQSEGQPVQFIPFLADFVAEGVLQNELIRREALKMGITVSDEAVDQELKSRGRAVNQVSRDIVRAEMLISKVQDEYIEQQVPVFAEQRHILAMFLESESQADEVRTNLENGGDFAELADRLSLDDFSKTNQGDLGWRPKGILANLLGNSIVEEHAYSLETGALSQPLLDETKTKAVGYWLIKLLGRSQDLERANIQVILLGSEEEAKAVRGRILAGQDFGELAKELSLHEESREEGGEGSAGGGDLGWITPGIMSTGVDEFAFDPEVEMKTLSQPVRDDTVVTEGGYWLLKVVDIDDNREIGDEDRDLLKAKALDKWLSALWDDPENKVENYLDGQKKEWAISQVSRR